MTAPNESKDVPAKEKFNVLTVLSAYTGVLMCKFSDMHEYIEKVMERAVWTHQLADQRIQDEIRDKIKSNGDFDKAINQISALESRIKVLTDAGWNAVHAHTRYIKHETPGTYDELRIYIGCLRETLSQPNASTEVKP